MPELCPDCREFLSVLDASGVVRERACPLCGCTLTAVGHRAESARRPGPLAADSADFPLFWVALFFGSVGFFAGVTAPRMVGLLTR